MARAFEPGWEIGVQADEGEDHTIHTVAHIDAFGGIVLDDDTCWQSTGQAWDADDDEEYPRLVPITKAWRRARKAQAVARLLRDVHWPYAEDDTLIAVYELLVREGFFEPYRVDDELDEMNAERLAEQAG